MQADQDPTTSSASASDPILARYTWTLRLQYFWLAFLPFLVTLSHRNVVAMVALMALPLFFTKAPYQALCHIKISKFKTLSYGQKLFILAMGLAIYMSFTVLWAHIMKGPASFLRAPLFIAVIAVLFWFLGQLSQDQHRRLLTMFAWSALFASLFMAFECLTDGLVRDTIKPEDDPARGDNATARGFAIIVAIFPFATLALTRGGGGTPYKTPNWLRGILLGLAFFGLAVGSLKFNISSNAVTVVLMISAGLSAVFLPKLTTRLIFAVFALSMMFAPFIINLLDDVQTLAQITNLEVSWAQRLVIWRISADHIFSSIPHFLFGHGVDYARWLSSFGDTIAFAGASTAKGAPAMLATYPTHPHNVFVHIWLEFGLVGAALSTMCFWQLWRLLEGRFLQKETMSRAFIGVICAICGAIFVSFAVESSLWTFWRFIGPFLGIFGLALIYQINSHKFYPNKP